MATIDTHTFATRPSLLRRSMQRKTMIVGIAVLVIFALAGALAPWVTPYSPSRLSVANRLLAPSSMHLFGTDDFGRDVFTRVVYSARASLFVGFAVVVFSSIVGVTLGLLAGFFRRLDPPISRLLDAMMSFPDILLAISLVAALGPTLVNVIVALGIVYAPRLARIVRASTLVIRELPYVEAARAIGASTPHIMIMHVLRNITSPILVQGTFIFASAILAEAGLSFLGVGVSPDVPTWGTMISLGRQYMDQAWWILLFPGLAVVIAVLSLQLVGDGLRDLLDPRFSKDL
ncbi:MULTISPECIES: ABC transporter permease [unclassified Chelatococcus]|uniref:ABC transporter permease n=1 Tax=unclassified Chelatococcus TaxID=2638111 RepID=UPI001BCF2661|nr:MULTISPECIES: ABC transporter permease [unclassified Chelatococcus]MBS7699319.1 ABC transporter permease [Chelatococcus sp. YT9]MBX3557549.1 ABC transporter permease [Chelatococcus sp.]